MRSRTGWQHNSWKAIASVAITGVALVGTGAMATAAPPVSAPANPAEPVTADDDEASVALLEEAILELAVDDDAQYGRLLDSAISGEVWLPEHAIIALLDRDAEWIDNWAMAIDADAVDLLDDVAFAVIEFEQAAVDQIDDSMTDEENANIDDADNVGAGVLQLIDRRGLDIADSTRLVLTSIFDNDGLVPSPNQYQQALDDLDVTIAQFDEPSGETTTDADPIDTPVVDTALTDDPVADMPAAASGAADVATLPETAPAEATPVANTAGPAESSDAMPLSMILTLAVAGFALLIALFAVTRGRKSGDLTDDLVDIAFTDSLTGLKNRRRLDSDLAAQRAAGERITATLMVDVDHFKKFNDEHGHAMGDEVLRLVGEALAGQFRKKDVPYRYGGEEFCVILADTTHDEALAAGERARQAIHDIVLPVPGVVTASIGVSTGTATDVAETIKRADKALYDAKAAGRNRVAFG